MREARITAEIQSDELAGLIATTGRADRVTAQMPVVTLKRLRESTMTLQAIGPAYSPERGGMALTPSSHRLVVIATSALVTMAAAFGLAALMS